MHTSQSKITVSLYVLVTLLKKQTCPSSVCHVLNEYVASPDPVQVCYIRSKLNPLFDMTFDYEVLNTKPWSYDA